MEISRIENLIKQAAASRNAVYEENDNVAVQAQQSVNEPIIPLPNTQPAESGTAPAPAVKPTPAMLHQFIKTHFVENRDFMHLPGIPKPILTKTGSISILRYMGLRAVPRLLSAVFDQPAGVVSYTFETTLVDSEGSPVVSAVGAASTAEKKYAKSGIDAINTVCNMAYKRSLIAATKLLL